MDMRLVQHVVERSKLCVTELTCIHNNGGMSDIVIRPALDAEQRSLEALQWRASLVNPGDRDALLSNPDAISLPLEQITDGDVFVAESEGVVVGFAVVLARSDGDAELDGLFVEPSLWKGGVGRLLVQHCAVVASSRGSRIMHVVGNRHAEGFYVRCGFRVVGSAETRFGSGLAMQRALD
jgi:GNAT superfamily N-acetyltransferase